MATIEQKVACEHRARELVAEQGLPVPDYVEYGFTCIRLLWQGPKLMLVIEIDHEADDLPVVLIDRRHPSQPPLAQDDELYGNEYNPLVLIETTPTRN